MSKRLSIWFCFLVTLVTYELFSQPPVENNAFQTGEQLDYNVKYSSALGDFIAGKATIRINECINDEGNPGFHFVGTGETNNFFDVFYRVVDRFESKVDSATLLPYNFIRNTREGTYFRDDTVYFNRLNNTAFTMREEILIPEDVHDIVSAVFYMRTLTVEDFGEDSAYLLNFYLDDSVYHSVIKFEGRGVIETKWGWLPCLKVYPMLAIGEVFTNKYPMSVWITDDKNHIPVMAESEVVVGSVKMELADYKGLKNPFIKPLSRKELKSYKK